MNNGVELVFKEVNKKPNKEKTVNENNINNNNNNNKKYKEYDINDNEIIYYELPHKKPLEYILVTIRELIIVIFKYIFKLKNPLKYIYSNPDREFAFCLLVIFIGVILLLFNLISQSKI